MNIAADRGDVESAPGDLPNLGHAHSVNFEDTRRVIPRFMEWIWSMLI